MDDPAIHDPVARVVTWHNRHPLAQRIQPEHVSGVGVVSLPFVAADEPPAKPWQRWPKMLWQKVLLLARRPEKPAFAPRLKAAFSEDLIAPISAKRVAAFALRHGSPERPGAADLPQREVAVDEKLASGSVVRLYLITACVEKGKGRVRVLQGSVAKAKFLGARLWEKPKTAAAAAVAVLLVAAAVAIGMMWGGATDADGDKAAGVVSAASAAQVTAAVPAASEPVKPESPELPSANASAPTGASGVAQASEPAAFAEQADSAAVSASAAADRSAKSDAPTEVDAAQDTEAIELGAKQPLRPGLSSEERAEAVRQANLLRSQTPAPPAAVAKPTKVYALVTSLTGTRAASERRLRMMGLSFAGGKMSGDLRSEIMKVDKGWRATLWPFTSRADAEAARDMLADRGVYTEVLAF